MAQKSSSLEAMPTPWRSTRSRSTRAGVHILAVATDVPDEVQCIALMEAATERFGTVDGIAQIAALDTVLGNLASTSAKSWARIISVNAVGGGDESEVFAEINAN